jgi:hypothetical protein
VRVLPTAIGPTTVPCTYRRLHDELIVKSNVEGEPDTKLICGRLRFEHIYLAQRPFSSWSHDGDADREVGVSRPPPMENRYLGRGESWPNVFEQ